MDRSKPTVRKVGGSSESPQPGSSSLEGRELTGRSQAVPPRPTPAPEGSTPASGSTGERTSFRFGRKNAGNQKGRSLADLSQNAVVAPPTEANGVEGAAAAAPAGRQSRWSTLSSSNSTSGADGVDGTSGADSSGGGSGGFSGLPMPRSKASWGSAPWSRQERELWNNVLKRLRELAQNKTTAGSGEVDCSGSSVAAAGVAAPQGASQNSRAAEEEQGTRTGGSFSTLRQELDAQLDVLAGLTLPNHTISPPEVGIMVAALVALAPANSAPLAARVCRFIILACTPKPWSAAHAQRGTSHGSSNASRASSLSTDQSSSDNYSKTNHHNSRQRGPASPSPATRDAGLLSDHAAAAAAATDSLAAPGPSLGSQGGGGGGCVIEDQAALGQLFAWFQSALEFAVSVEAIEARSGLAKDVLRALAQVLHVPSHVVALVSVHSSMFTPLLSAVSVFAARTNQGLATSNTGSGSSSSTRGAPSSASATSAPLTSTLKLKVYDAEALHAALDIFANLVTATSAAAAATAAAILVAATAAEADERAQVAALDAASIAVVNAVDVVRIAAWEAAYACFQTHWRPFVRGQATSPQASRLLGPALRCLQIAIGHDQSRFSLKGGSANAARKRALVSSGSASSSAASSSPSSSNNSSTLPLHDNGVLEGLLLALHHLLQPKQPLLPSSPSSRSGHSQGEQEEARTTTTSRESNAADEGVRSNSNNSRPHRSTTHQRVQLHALALLSKLAAQYPTHLYEHWHLFLPVKSERNRTQRLIELRKHHRTTSTTATSQPLLSDAPLAAPLPTLLLESLEPCVAVRASAAHAAAALVTNAPLRQWLGALAETLKAPLLHHSHQQKDPTSAAAPNQGRRTANAKNVSKKAGVPARPAAPSAAGALAIAAGLMSKRLSSGMSRLGNTTHPGFLAVKVHDTIGTLHDLLAEALDAEVALLNQADSSVFVSAAPARIGLCATLQALLAATPYAVLDPLEALEAKRQDFGLPDPRHAPSPQQVSGSGANTTTGTETETGSSDAAAAAAAREADDRAAANKDLCVGGHFATYAALTKGKFTSWPSAAPMFRLSPNAAGAAGAANPTTAIATSTRIAPPATAAAAAAPSPPPLASPNPSAPATSSRISRSPLALPPPPLPPLVPSHPSIPSLALASSLPASTVVGITREQRHMCSVMVAQAAAAEKARHDAAAAAEATAAAVLAAELDSGSGSQGKKSKKKNKANEGALKSKTSAVVAAAPPPGAVELAPVSPASAVATREDATETATATPAQTLLTTTTVNVAALRSEGRRRVGLLERRLGLFGLELLRLVGCIMKQWLLQGLPHHHHQHASDAPSLSSSIGNLPTSSSSSSSHSATTRTLLLLFSTKQPLRAVDFYLGTCDFKLPSSQLPIDDASATAASSSPSSAPSSLTPIQRLLAVARDAGSGAQMRGEALMLLSRLARNYAPRIAEHWSEVDTTLQRCFRSMDPALRLRAVRVGEEMLGACAHAHGHYLMTVTRGLPESNNEATPPDPTSAAASTSSSASSATATNQTPAGAPAGAAAAAPAGLPGSGFGGFASAGLGPLTMWSRQCKAKFVDASLCRAMNDPSPAVRGVAVSCFGYLLPEDWDLMAPDLRQRAIGQAYAAALSDTDGAVQALGCRVVGVLGSFVMFKPWAIDLRFAGGNSSRLSVELPTSRTSFTAATTVVKTPATFAAAPSAAWGVPRKPPVTSSLPERVASTPTTTPAWPVLPAAAQQPTASSATSLNFLSSPFSSLAPTSITSSLSSTGPTSSPSPTPASAQSSGRGFVEQTVWVLAAAARDTKVATRSQAFWAIGNFAAGMSLLAEDVNALEATATAAASAASESASPLLPPAVTAAAAGTLHTTESIADAAAVAAEASAEAKAAAALWRGLEYWPLELGTVVLAGFDDQHKVAASAVRASAYIAPHLLARAVGTFTAHKHGTSSSTLAQEQSNAAANRSSASRMSSSKSEDSESVVGDKAAALLEDIVTDLIAKVRAAVPTFTLEGRGGGGGGGTSISSSWRPSVSSSSWSVSGGGGGASLSSSRLGAASSSTTTTTSNSGTANAAITKQSWNACHALGRVLAAVKGSVLHAALAHTARLSNHSNRGDSRLNNSNTTTNIMSSSISHIINSSAVKNAKKPGGNFYSRSEHASYGRLESGGGGGGNGDDVLAARWAQRRKRRALGSGPLPWFDHAFGALTAVLAESGNFKIRIHASAALQAPRSAEAYGGNLALVLRTAVAELQRLLPQGPKSLPATSFLSRGAGSEKFATTVSTTTTGNEVAVDATAAKYVPLLAFRLLRLVRHLLVHADPWLDLLPIANDFTWHHNDHNESEIHDKKHHASSSRKASDNSSTGMNRNNIQAKNSASSSSSSDIEGWTMRTVIDSALILKPPPRSKAQRERAAARAAQRREDASAAAVAAAAVSGGGKGVGGGGGGALSSTGGGGGGALAAACVSASAAAAAAAGLRGRPLSALRHSFHKVRMGDLEGGGDGDDDDDDDTRGGSLGGGMTGNGSGVSGSARGGGGPGNGLSDAWDDDEDDAWRGGVVRRASAGLVLGKVRDVLEYYERTEGMQSNQASQHYEQRLAQLEELARPSLHVQPFQTSATSFKPSVGAAADGAWQKSGQQLGSADSRTLHAHRNRSELAGTEGAESPDSSSLASPVRSEESYDVTSTVGSRTDGETEHDRKPSSENGGDGGVGTPDNKTTDVDAVDDNSADEELEL